MLKSMEDLSPKKKRRQQNRESQRRFRARKRTDHGEETDFCNEEAPLLDLHLQGEAAQPHIYHVDRLSFPVWLSSSTANQAGVADTLPVPLTPVGGISPPGVTGPSHFGRNPGIFTTSSQNDVDFATISSSEPVNMDYFIPHMDPQNLTLPARRGPEALFTPMPTENSSPMCNPQGKFSHRLPGESAGAEQSNDRVKLPETPASDARCECDLSRANNASPKKKDSKESHAPRVILLLQEIRTVYDFSVSMGLLENDQMMRAKLSSLYQQFQSLVQHRERKLYQEGLRVAKEDVESTDDHLGAQDFEAGWDINSIVQSLGTSQHL